MEAIKDAMLAAWPDCWELEGRGEPGKSSGEKEFRRLERAREQAAESEEGAFFFGLSKIPRDSFVFLLFPRRL